MEISHLEEKLYCTLNSDLIAVDVLATGLEASSQFQKSFLFIRFNSHISKVQSSDMNRQKGHDKSKVAVNNHNLEFSSVT